MSLRRERPDPDLRVADRVPECHCTDPEPPTRCLPAGIGRYR